MRKVGFLKRAWTIRFPRGARNRADEAKARKRETSRGRALRAGTRPALTPDGTGWFAIALSVPVLVMSGYFVYREPWLSIPIVLTIVFVLRRSRKRS